MKTAAAALMMLSFLAAGCGGGAPSGKKSYECGPVAVTATFNGDAATLQTGDDVKEFRRVESKGGAKYEAVGDPTTSFVVDGDNAILTIGGVGYPECVEP